MSEKPEPGADGKCFQCEAAIDDVEEYFCSGCKEVFCDEHSEAPWGEHQPVDHEDYQEA